MLRKDAERLATTQAERTLEAQINAARTAATAALTVPGGGTLRERLQVGGRVEPLHEHLDPSTARESDVEHLVGALQVGVGPLVQHERAVAADPGDDHLAVFGMLADLAGEVEQAQGLVDIH